MVSVSVSTRDLRAVGDDTSPAAPGASPQVNHRTGTSPEVVPRSMQILDHEEPRSAEEKGAYDWVCFVVCAVTEASTSSPSTTSGSSRATVARRVLLPVSGSVK